MPKLKIAFVTTTIETGGAEGMVLKLVAGLDKQRFAPVVVVLSGRTAFAEQFEKAGAQVVILGMRGPFGRVIGLARVPASIWRLKPDVLQGWMVHGNLAAQIAGTLFGIPVIWGVRHSQLIRGQEKTLTRTLEVLMKYLSKLPARIVYNSNAGKLRHEALGYDIARSAVIPNGFDLSAFLIDKDARERFRRLFQISEETVVIGMVARYHPVKDHATFLEAAGALSRQWSNLLFVLVGAGCDPKNIDLATAIERQGLTSRVQLLRERSDVQAIANAFDIGVLSSSSEGFPNVVGELMACGIPCVVTDV